MKDLKQVTVIGLGLLGGSITLAVSRAFAGVKTVGYTHRAVTRRKARRLSVADEVADDLRNSMARADLVILATPIFTFEEIFEAVAGSLQTGCIVTDVGSTKVLPHRWAARHLPKSVHYVGSHPITGSEQRGVEFARDDLFDRAMCILTKTKATNKRALGTLKSFWSGLGCVVRMMTPTEHDRVFANVSHLPHVTAAALINANKADDLAFAGSGFMDTTRIASGPAGIWRDVLLSNIGNLDKGIDKIVRELLEIKSAIKAEDERRIEKLLEAARDKRNALVKYKLKKKELMS